MHGEQTGDRTAAVPDGLAASTEPITRNIGKTIVKAPGPAARALRYRIGFGARPLVFLRPPLSHRAFDAFVRRARDA